MLADPSEAIPEVVLPFKAPSILIENPCLNRCSVRMMKFLEEHSSPMLPYPASTEATVAWAMLEVAYVATLVEATSLAAFKVLGQMQEEELKEGGSLEPMEPIEEARLACSFELEGDSFACLAYRIQLPFSLEHQ